MRVYVQVFGNELETILKQIQNVLFVLTFMNYKRDKLCVIIRVCAHLQMCLCTHACMCVYACMFEGISVCSYIITKASSPPLQYSKPTFEWMDEQILDSK